MKKLLSELFGSQKDQTILLLIWCTFLCVNVLVVATWYLKNYYGFDGDEPHYLAIMSSITQYGTLDQYSAYQQDFIAKNFYNWPEEATMSTWSHTVQGPHGYFNVHGIGIAVILALPFVLGGPIGVKIGVICLSSLIIPMLWAITRKFSSNLIVQIFAVAIPTFAMPFIPASSLIFPDLTAGVMGLVGICWLFGSGVSQNKYFTSITIGIIAFLPWLHSRFMLMSLVLLFAILIKLLRHKCKETSARLFIWYGSIPLVSFAALISYNLFAFGQLSGAFGPDAVGFNIQALTVFFGLFLDQNHGILIQNPAYWVGFAFLGSFFYKYRLVGSAIILSFLSNIFINAINMDSYGGWSFSGRFVWTSATIFLPVVVYGFVKLFEFSQKLFWLVTAISAIVQAYYLYIYTLSGTLLWNRQGAEFSEYAILWRGIYLALPALYDSAWAWTHIPNFLFILLFVCLITIGFVIPSRSAKANFSKK